MLQVSLREAKPRAFEQEATRYACSFLLYFLGKIKDALPRYESACARQASRF